MMIRSAAIATALLLIPSALAAQTPETGQGRLEIVGEAPGACVVRGPSTANTSNATYVTTGLSSGEVRINQMVDSNSVARAASADLELTVVCNSPHQLVVRSENGGLLRRGAIAGSAQGGPFAEFLPYRFRATWLGQENGASSNAGGPLVMSSNRSGAGELSLAVTVPAGSRLAQGDYRDAVILEFRAAN